MAFGLTSTGFNTKRLADITAEINAALQAELGAGINLSPSSPLGQIVGIIAEQEAQIWELAEGVYNSQYPDTAENTSLDNVASITNITRIPATKSVVEVRVFGTALTTIPAIGAFIISVLGDSTARFVNTETGAIAAAGIDEVQNIAFTPTPTAGNWKLRYNGSETTGALAFNETAGNVQTALNGLTSLSGVTVTGSMAAGFDVTFAGADGDQDQPLLEVVDNTLSAPGVVTATVTETTRGWQPFIDLDFAAETAGPTQAPTGSLTVIETPAAGIDGVENLAAADVGNDTETDAELRQRRQQQLQRAGSATVEGIRNNVLEVENVDQVLVIENSTLIVDAGGRPGKSFETVVQGGANADIAQAIFEAKPAGIEAYGDIIVAVTDSQGFSHNIGFSRPTDIDIWMIVNITPNVDPSEGAVYPVDGDAQVTAKVLEFAADLQIGNDVIVNQFYTPINEVDGVFGIQILVGFANPPVASANLSIAADEIAVFDAARITVNS